MDMCTYLYEIKCPVKSDDENKLRRNDDFSVFHFGFNRDFSSVKPNLREILFLVLEFRLNNGHRFYNLKNFNIISSHFACL